MTNPTDLPALISRLEKAEGADRELAFAFFEAVEATDEQRRKIAEARADIAKGLLIEDDLLGWRSFYESLSLRALNGSLDAAVALVERELPDYGWFIRRDDTDANGKRAAPVYNAALLYPDALRVTPGTAQAPIPALALCLALLNAMQAEKMK